MIHEHAIVVGKALMVITRCIDEDESLYPTDRYPWLEPGERVLFKDWIRDSRGLFVRVTVPYMEDRRKYDLNPENLIELDCRACKYCGVEPQDMDFTCHHPESGHGGLHLHTLSNPRLPDGHCGPDAKNFEQHPGRNPDGSLKSQSDLATLVSSGADRVIL